MRVDEAALTLIIIILLASIALAIVYLLTLQNTLKLVSQHNRKMAPGEVWLVFIPLFGIVWNFIMIGKIADSLRAEFDERNITVADQRPGYNIGVASASLNVAGFLPAIGTLLSLAGLVCWIIYWVKIAEFKRMLGAPNKYADQVLD